MSSEEKSPEVSGEQAGTPLPKTSEMHAASRWEIYFPTHLDAERDAVHVASFMPMIYFWPTMLVFLVCGAIQSFQEVQSGTLGWIAVIVFTLNVLVIVQDFDQKKFLILVLALVVLGLGIWIINMKGFTFLKDFAQWLIGLSPTFSTSAYLVMGVLLAILFVWSLIRPMFNYWRFEHNEFVHYVQPFGRDQSVPRMGSTVSKEVPDMLEYLLSCGGGSLVIRREGETIAEIPHIPFLGRRMRALEKLLSETRVTTL